MIRYADPDRHAVALLGAAVDGASSPVTDDLRALVLARLRHEFDLLRAQLDLPDRGLEGAGRVAEAVIARLPRALE